MRAQIPEKNIGCSGSRSREGSYLQVSGVLFIWVLEFDEHSDIVYSLWKHPKLVPLLHTVDFVVEKLRTGSPLMIPGLAGGPPFPSSAVENAIVAIASVENPSVPKVVGICEIDVSSLKQIHGVKGHAVRSEHWEGDELWAWNSSGGTQGGVAPAEIPGWIASSADTTLSQRVNSVRLEENDEDDEGGVALDNKLEPQQQIDPQNEAMKAEDAEPFERVEVELSTKGRLRAILNSVDVH